MAAASVAPPPRRGRRDSSVMFGMLFHWLPSQYHRPTIPDLSSSSLNNNNSNKAKRKRVVHYYVVLIVASIFVLTSISVIPNNNDYYVVDSSSSNLQVLQHLTTAIDSNNSTRTNINDDQGKLMTTIQTAEMKKQSMSSTNNNKNTTKNKYLNKNEYIPNENISSVASTSSIMSDQNKLRKKQNLKLRFDWTNLQPTFELTKLYREHQNNCSLPLGDFLYRNEYGMGSDLHYWGKSLCNGLTTGRRIRTVGNWTWFDQESCNNTSQYYSPMLCYFPKSELQCPKQDYEYVQNHPDFNLNHKLCQADGRIRNVCRSVLGNKYSIQDQNFAGIEYLFLNVSPLVVSEAERQINLIFGGDNNGEGIPKDLITVHIRWGDKGVEMRLVDIRSYIQAIYKILDDRSQRGGDDGGVSINHNHANIFLATEDPKAVKAFRDAMPSTWNLYLDQFYVDMLPHRIKGYNGNPKMSIQTKGKAGLVTLASLLVAMESNDFVLTTASNWSRMMNELRLAIVDPRCGGCTSVIDLRKPNRRNNDL